LDEAKVILLSRMQEIRDSQAKDAAETPVPATKEFRTRQNDEAGGFSKKGERSFTIDQARKVLHTINDPSGSSVANGGLGAVSGNLDEGGIAFAKHNEERLRTMVHLLMSLDQTTIWSMRREFKKRNWRLSMYEFILVASSFMKSQDIVHLDALCEMFKEIDVQGDGKMEWEEFTAHLVQLASSGVNSADDTSPRYQFSLDEDLVRHDYHCDYIKYHPDFGRFVVFERTSSRFKIYSSPK